MISSGWGEDATNLEKDISHANREIYNRVACSETLLLSSGSDFEWEFAEPSLLLAELVDRCPSLAQAIGEAANRRRGVEGAWGVSLAFDEYVPGSKRRLNNKRKVVNIAFSFDELSSFGHVDSCWIIPAVLRTSILKRIKGGWSHALMVFLRRMFLGPHGFGTVGAIVRINGEFLIIHAKLNLLFSDLNGLRMAYDWRGAGSLRPCLMCNVFMKN
jgi:hypothetical protein